VKYTRSIKNQNVICPRCQHYIIAVESIRLDNDPASCIAWKQESCSKCGAIMNEYDHGRTNYVDWGKIDRY
jgi:ribosomal protein S27AE